VEETTAIVIFGAAVRPDGSPSPTLRRRVEAAYAFGAQHQPVLYVPTGAVGRYGPSEAQVMAELLNRLGVANQDILHEETGTNTMKSALAVSRLLKGHSGPIYAASSHYHLPRCCLLLRLAGCRARPCPPPAHGWQCYQWLREAVALPIDVLLMSFGRYRSPPNANRA
jgi:vancomycin permeability regulator SanA